MDAEQTQACSVAQILRATLQALLRAEATSDRHQLFLDRVSFAAQQYLAAERSPTAELHSVTQRQSLRNRSLKQRPDYEEMAAPSEWWRKQCEQYYGCDPHASRERLQAELERETSIVKREALMKALAAIGPAVKGVDIRIALRRWRDALGTLAPELEKIEDVFESAEIRTRELEHQLRAQDLELRRSHGVDTAFADALLEQQIPLLEHLAVPRRVAGLAELIKSARDERDRLTAELAFRWLPNEKRKQSSKRKQADASKPAKATARGGRPEQAVFGALAAILHAGGFTHAKVAELLGKESKADNAQIVRQQLKRERDYQASEKDYLDGPRAELVREGHIREE